MRISHASCGVRDLDEVAQRLRVDRGLGLWRFPQHLGAHVPLGQDQYIELYAPGHPLWHLGWIAWSVVVDDLDEWIAALHLSDARRFGDDPTRTFTPWRGRLAGTTASRTSGGVLPYLIEYEGSVDLASIFADKHRAARHDVEVGPIARIESDGTRLVDVAVEIGGVAVSMPLA